MPILCHVILADLHEILAAPHVILAAPHVKMLFTCRCSKKVNLYADSFVTKCVRIVKK